MDRPAATADRPKHAWERAGLAAAPFQVVAGFQMPDDAMVAAEPTLYGPAAEHALSLAKALGVPAGECQDCGAAIVDHFVVQGWDRRRFVACRDCVEHAGSRTLMTKVRHIEHERRRMTALLTNESNRRLPTNQRSDG